MQVLCVIKRGAGEQKDWGQINCWLFGGEREAERELKREKVMLTNNQKDKKKKKKEERWGAYCDLFPLAPPYTSPNCSY